MVYNVKIEETKVFTGQYIADTQADAEALALADLENGYYDIPTITKRNIVATRVAEEDFYEGCTEAMAMNWINTGGDCMLAVIEYRMGNAKGDPRIWVACGLNCVAVYLKDPEVTNEDNEPIYCEEFDEYELSLPSLHIFTKFCQQGRAAVNLYMLCKSVYGNTPICVM